MVALSFVGYILAGPHGRADRLHALVYQPLWCLHVIGSRLFIA